MADEIILTPADAEALTDGNVDEQPESKGTEATPEEPKVEEPDYKVKFSESTRENQRIVSENKTLAGELARERELREKLEREQKEYFDALSQDDPDKAKSITLEKRVKETQDMILKEKEEREIKEFIASTPEASSAKESLRKIMRLEPHKSLSEIWDENFKPVVETTTKAKIAKEVKAKAEQVETGKGSVSKDTDGGVDINSPEFNKLPLEKRKEILMKKGY